MLSRRAIKLRGIVSPGEYPILVRFDINKRIINRSTGQIYSSIGFTEIVDAMEAFTPEIAFKVVKDGRSFEVEITKHLSREESVYKPWLHWYLARKLAR